MKLIAPIFALAAVADAKKRGKKPNGQPIIDFSTGVDDCLNKGGLLWPAKGFKAWKGELKKCDIDYKKCGKNQFLKCEDVAECVKEKEIETRCVIKSEGEAPVKKPAKRPAKKPADKQPADSKPTDSKPVDSRPARPGKRPAKSDKKRRPKGIGAKDKRRIVCQRIREEIPNKLDSEELKNKFADLYTKRKEMAGKKMKKGDKSKMMLLKEWKDFVCENDLMDAIVEIKKDVLGSIDDSKYQCPSKEQVSTDDEADDEIEFIELEEEDEDGEDIEFDDGEDEEESEEQVSKNPYGYGKGKGPKGKGKGPKGKDRGPRGDGDKKKRGKGRGKGKGKIGGRSFGGSDASSDRQALFESVYKNQAFDAAYYNIVNEFKEFDTKKMNQAVNKLERLAGQPCINCDTYEDLEKFFTFDMGVHWTNDWNVISDTVVSFVDAWNAMENGENLDDLEF